MPDELDVTLPSRLPLLRSVEDGVITVSTELADVEKELEPDAEDEVKDADNVIVVLEMTMMLYVEVVTKEFDVEGRDDRVDADDKELLCEVDELVPARVALPAAEADEVRLSDDVGVRVELDAVNVDTVKLFVKVVVVAKTPVLKVGL
ncbi:uncharacterized protein AB675_6683 [Cyphellophora attinorum]|uniref:Uncharacterized protein n=1 Tax=Cyphellophora attinorum TaxID=1664694 RepID=A0A0N1HE65_9EURO|nr:uncharacterized protein AB675_6683 [Phialophora attinorum]KPI43166.1 hypothetical protein AB675_6683 [Phialophora attinorum]